MRAQLVTDSDLHVAHLAIVLSKTTAEAMPAVTIPKLKAVVLPKVLALLQSSLLQGVALRSLLALFAELVSQNVAELSFDALTTQLLSVGKAGTMSKHTLAALSQLVAACCAHVPAPAKRDTMVTHFTGQLSDGAAQQRTLALLCLGEIGRQTDLSAHKNLVAAVMTGFTMPEEEVKAAASFALGNIAAGNLPLYLPHLLKAIDTSQVRKANARIPLTSTSAFALRSHCPPHFPTLSAPPPPAPDQHEYLVLHALKDMIVSSGQEQLSGYVRQHAVHLRRAVLAPSSAESIPIPSADPQVRGRDAPASLRVLTA
jgi:hypothetical protein